MQYIVDGIPDKKINKIVLFESFEKMNLNNGDADITLMKEGIYRENKLGVMNKPIL